MLPGEALAKLSFENKVKNVDKMASSVAEIANSWREIIADHGPNNHQIAQSPLNCQPTTHTTIQREKFEGK